MDLQRCSAALESRSADEKPSANSFNCSICLDFASDPIVTLCGHLYCWACIYKWIDSQRSQNNTPQCPVCKVPISEKTIVPLYGPGQSQTLSEPDDEGIPPRPRLPYQDYYTEDDEGVSWIGSSSSREIEPLSCSYPFGDMVYARVFRNSMSLYTYPSSYHDVWNSIPRLRRRVYEADRSLSRVAIFLLCCLFLCLLLF